MQIRYLLAFGIAFLSVVSVGNAQALRSPFSFTFDPLGAANRTNFGFPAQDSIGASDFLQVRGGHFVDQKGQRFKIFGANFFYSACFPDSAEALGIAQRLHSFGFNAVRLVGFDHPYIFNGSIFSAAINSDELSEENLQRLDWFIYCLSKKGIRVMLMTHSEWFPRPADGMPQPDSIVWANKVLLYTEPRTQDIVRSTTMKLFNHVNRYNRRAYKSDPTIAFVQLSYDNSLFDYWRNGQLFHSPGGPLSDFYSRRIDTLFNRFLRSKYQNDMSLRAAWAIGAGDSRNLVPNGGFEDATDPLAGWEFFAAEGTTARLFPSDANKVEGSFSASIRISRAGTANFEVLLFNSGVRLQKGRRYELRFSARTTPEKGTRSLQAALYRNVQPFVVFNAWEQTITSNWQNFTQSFVSAVPEDSPLVFAFFMGQDNGDVFIDNVQIVQVADPGLATGESLDNFTVRRSRWQEEPSPGRMADNSAFYESLTSNYCGTIGRLLKDTLGVKALIAGGSNVGSLNEQFVFSRFDFTGSVTGWDGIQSLGNGAWAMSSQPQVGSEFGGTAWLLNNAKVANQPMVHFAHWQPFPSPYLNEYLTYLPIYNAYQDFDGVFLNAYAFDKSRLSTPYIDSIQHYEFKSNPAFMSLVPFAARLTRDTLIKPSQRVINIEQTLDARQRAPKMGFLNWLEYGSDLRMFMFRRVQTSRFDANIQSAAPHLSVPQLSGETVDLRNLISDTEEIVFNATDSVMTLSTPRAVMYTGRIGKVIATTAEQRIERRDAGLVGTFARLSLDSNKLAESDSSIVFLSSRSDNAGSVWPSAVYKQIWGAGPMQVEAMNIQYNFTSNADSVVVEPLDAAAEPLIGRTTPARRLSEGRFVVNLDQSQDQVLWYKLKAVRRPSSVHDIAREPGLELLSEHPVKSGNVMVAGPTEVHSQTLVSLYSPGGELVTSTTLPGTGLREAVSLSLTSVSSGSYLLVWRSGRFTATIPVAVVD